MNELRFRQVHLDFHTSPLIEDVGADFDPERFAKTLSDAHVDSVTCFSRCHHGYLYYQSRNLPHLMHPHLARPNLLGEQIEACHRRGIRVPVYTTVQWDDLVAKQHGDWLVLNEQGAPFNQPPFKSGFYRNLCLNSPYVDYLKAQVRDLFESLGELDGLFLDILNIKPCCCPNCLRDMLREGLDPEDETVRYEFAQRVMDRFMRDMTAFIHAIQPGCPVFYNVGYIGTRHRGVIDSFTHLEIESLPGGSWGYGHFPVTARYARTLGLDFMGMTGRFHTDWGDFGSLRNRAALEYECFKSLAYGGKCSIGDQLHPLGALNPATYRLIGSVYGQVEKKEPFCQGARCVSEAAVLIPEQFRRPGTPLVGRELSGATKLLTHACVQFDVVDTQADFSAYPLLVLPDDIPCDAQLCEKIGRFLSGGGKLIASGRAGLDEKGDFAPFMPVSCQGEAPYCPDYLVPEGELARGLEPENEYVMYDRAMLCAPRDGAQERLHVNTPYFNRTWRHFCSHRQAPSSGRRGYPAVVSAGGVIYFAHPVFTTYEVYGCRWIRTLVENALDELLPGRLIRHDGPSTLELSLTHQAQARRYVLHALNYIPQRRAEQLDIVEDVIPLSGVRVDLAVGRPVRSVSLAPEGESVAFEQEGGRLRFTIGRIEGHRMIAIDY